MIEVAVHLADVVQLVTRAPDHGHSVNGCVQECVSVFRKSNERPASQAITWSTALSLGVTCAMVCSSDPNWGMIAPLGLQ